MVLRNIRGECNINAGGSVRVGDDLVVSMRLCSIKKMKKKGVHDTGTTAWRSAAVQECYKNASRMVVKGMTSSTREK
jgi:hypothetical protein